MDQRARSNMGGLGGGGGLLSALGSLTGGGGAGGLLSALGGLGGLGGGGGGNPANLLSALSALGNMGGGGGNANPLGAISSIMGNGGNANPLGAISSLMGAMGGAANGPAYPPYNPPPYPPAAGFGGGANPLAGIDTNALMGRLSNLMSNLENAVPPAGTAQPGAGANFANPPGQDAAADEDAPIIDAETGQPETPPHQEQQGQPPPGMNPESMNNILSMLSSVLGNMQGQGNQQYQGAAYAPPPGNQTGAYGAPPPGNQGAYPPPSGPYQAGAAGAYGQGQPPQSPRQDYAPGYYSPGNAAPEPAPPGCRARLDEEPHSPCDSCNNPWCRQKAQLPTFAQVRQMAADWQRY